ncbi:uncharacterized protein FIESC28_08161 [Fusarium coffeatum]|uniref:Uncharacterized protein n=1 Tax=Fusarium coffeatum TaxID=231269 RepID=A0A366R8K3_9HYPO|nr:uncharacterized protein FIESC28_08161 [Fusarium coffeatum]RBR13484.1 hypothetical protein FIESC28_08161 [Fusarium coffeatum]
MDCPSTKLIDLLRACLPRWEEELEQIKDPDAALNQKLALIHDRSKSRIEEFSLNHLRDGVAIAALKQALLSDGRQIERLELERKDKMKQHQELQNADAEAVAGKIIGDLVNILGLDTAQKLAPVLYSRQPVQEPDRDLCDSNDVERGSRRPKAVTNTAISTSDTGYNTRNRQKYRQRPSPSVNEPCSGESSSAKRKLALDVDNERPPKLHRSAGTKTQPAKASRSDSVSPPSTLSIRSPGSHQYSSIGGKALAIDARRGMTTQSRKITFGGDRTAQVTVHRDSSNELWICAVKFSQGQNTRRIDNFMGRSIIPGFLQLVNRDHAQVTNRRERQQSAQQEAQVTSRAQFDSKDNEPTRPDVDKKKKF